MSDAILLLPQVRKMEQLGGVYNLSATGEIALDVPQAQELLFTAGQLKSALTESSGTDGWCIVAGAFSDNLIISLDSSMEHEQAYTLTINDDGIRIIGSDTAGAHYGVLTLIQLIQTYGYSLPKLHIDDYPDFPARGVMLDVTRDKVPTMSTLFMLIDKLASWKINQIQLYMEHSFAYRNHKTVWEKASPFTPEEIMQIDTYCKQHFIELVPNQNSFGHMHRWFRHEQYKHLAETDGPAVNPWGGRTEYPFSLSPVVPESLDLVREMHAELLPNFSSRMFNVGCDETFDIGQGKSAKAVEEKGVGRVYIDYLKEIYKIVQSHDRIMQYWGDIIVNHPDLVPELPDDAIAMEWGYEANHPFESTTKLFAESGKSFYVCPGTSSWRTIAGRTDNVLGNIRKSVEYGLKYGAIGVLITDWGDEGHWQTLPISYLGFAYGAAISWAFDANVDMDVQAVLNQYVFMDSAGVMGKLVYEIGNVYQVAGLFYHNSSILFNSYFRPLEQLQQSSKSNPMTDQTIADDPELLCEKLHETLDAVEKIMQPLSRAKMQVPDAERILDEFRLTQAMLEHGAKRVLFQIGFDNLKGSDLQAELDELEANYRRVWLERNRIGGLNDSAARLTKAKQLYT